MRRVLQTEVELVAGDRHLRCWVSGHPVAVGQWVTLVDDPAVDQRWRVAQIFGTREESAIEGWAVAPVVEPGDDRHRPDAPHLPDA